MISSTDLFIDYQIDRQKDYYAQLRRQRTYLELAKTLKGADLPIIDDALEEIQAELNYE